ncbi:zinc finger transcriptional activator [Fusarium torreyae]|uniref:Zinc finger transcriptional activator n=1 Tax=Fusarium torreyae TaxID=1237075 RepID=A0A9W8RSM0_9HYPO|nr:zinc finger transcriptional activator [Fusarium torreyae]
MPDCDGNVEWQDLDLGVASIDQGPSPQGSKRRRAYLSCERCRKRKARCEPAPDQNEPCKRCSEDNQLCEFRTSRRTKRKLPLPVENVDLIHMDTVFNNTDSPSAMGRGISVPSANRGDCIDERLTNHPSQGLSTTAALDARARLVSTHIHNTSDALDLLTFAAADKQAYTSPSASSTRGSQVLSLALINAASDSPRNQDKVWKNFILIRKGIVSQQEVTEYLSFFFEQLWPLKPIVPTHYCDKNTWVQLVAEEPLLVMCLITLSSRYYSLPGRHGEMKSERIHWQAWRIVQRSLQSVMWGSTTTRSLGAITSMLLLIDWHIKAINNPSDFTEGEDEGGGYANYADDGTPDFEDSPNGTDSLTGKRRYGMMSLMEKLKIVSPAYRSNKMSWSLLSNAISLAHEGCCFQSESPNSSSASSSKDSATLTNPQDVNQTHPNILLLRSVVNALHAGSPDDSHMAIRYAKFLGIMIQVALPVVSNDPNTSLRIEAEENSNDVEAPVGSEPDVPTRTSLFHDVDVEGISDWGDFLDMELGLDPFTWWESTNG